VKPVTPVVKRVTYSTAVIGWTPEPDTQYDIFMARKQDFNFSLIKSKLAAGEFEVQNLEKGKSYLFKIRAYNSCGASEESAEVDATIPSGVPEKMPPVKTQKLDC
jgi:hypothetical protein